MSRGIAYRFFARNFTGQRYEEIFRVWPWECQHWLAETWAHRNGLAGGIPGQGQDGTGDWGNVSLHQKRRKNIFRRVTPRQGPGIGSDCGGLWDSLRNEFIRRNKNDSCQQ